MLDAVSGSPVAEGNRGPPSALSMRASTIVHARPTSGVVRALVFRTACRQRPYPFIAVDFLGGHADDLADARASEQLHAQTVSGCGREAFKPRPQRADFFGFEDAVAWDAMTVSRKAASGIEARSRATRPT